MNSFEFISDPNFRSVLHRPYRFKKRLVMFVPVESDAEGSSVIQSANIYTFVDGAKVIPRVVLITDPTVIRPNAGEYTYYISSL